MQSEFVTACRRRLRRRGDVASLPRWIGVRRWGCCWGASAERRDGPSEGRRGPPNSGRAILPSKNRAGPRRDRARVGLASTTQPVRTALCDHACHGNEQGADSDADYPELALKACAPNMSRRARHCEQLSAIERAASSASACGWISRGDLCGHARAGHPRYVQHQHHCTLATLQAG